MTSRGQANSSAILFNYYNMIKEFKSIPIEEMTRKEWARRKLIASDALLLGLEMDRALETKEKEQRGLYKTISAGILSLTAILGAGHAHVEANKDYYTQKRVEMQLASGFIPGPELTTCQKIGKDNFFAKAGRPIARMGGWCRTELAEAGMKEPKIIVSFNNADNF